MPYSVDPALVELEIRDDRLTQLVTPDLVAHRFTIGFVFLEGPV